jgi:hypothetical protein
MFAEGRTLREDFPTLTTFKGFFAQLKPLILNKRWAHNAVLPRFIIVLFTNSRCGVPVGEDCLLQTDLLTFLALPFQQASTLPGTIFGESFLYCPLT